MKESSYRSRKENDLIAKCLPQVIFMVDASKVSSRFNQDRAKARIVPSNEFLPSLALLSTPSSDLIIMFFCMSANQPIRYRSNNTISGQARQPRLSIITEALKRKIMINDHWSLIKMSDIFMIKVSKTFLFSFARVKIGDKQRLTFASIFRTVQHCVDQLAVEQSLSNVKRANNTV